nr:hypothetical protein [Tanacetum cinerariifolium]
MVIWKEPPSHPEGEQQPTKTEEEKTEEPIETKVPVQAIPIQAVTLTPITTTSIITEVPILEVTPPFEVTPISEAGGSLFATLRAGKGKGSEGSCSGRGSDLLIPRVLAILFSLSYLLLREFIRSPTH